MVNFNTNKLLKISKSLHKTHHLYLEMRTFHVTFAIYRGKLMSIGINNTKTHPIIKKLNYCSNDGEDLRNIARTHSELNCVLKLKNKFPSIYLDDIIFVNIRLDRMGNVRYSKPCNGCTHLMEQVGYKKIYYSGYCGNFFELNKR